MPSLRRAMATQDAEGKVISIQSIDASVNWLRDNADAAAKARADREYLEQYTKVLKATIMRENPSLSLGAQEATAYADQRYLTHLEGLKAAIEQDEKLRWLRVAAEARISAWQSMNANERILGKL